MSVRTITTAIFGSVITTFGTDRTVVSPFNEIENKNSYFMTFFFRVVPIKYEFLNSYMYFKVFLFGIRSM